MASNMNIQTVIASFVLLLCFTKKALSYSGGAPTSQCVAMTPQGPHGSGRPHDNSPFEITSSAIPDGYIPGQTYNVTISKKQTSDPDFKGYLCQVRQVGQTAAFGIFTPRNTTKSKSLACTSANGAVTHTNKDAVSEQVFDWTPGQLGVGTDVQVVCTVVQQTSTLWVQLTSATFQEITPLANGTDPSTVEITKVSPPQQQPTSPSKVTSTVNTTTESSASAGRQATNITTGRTSNPQGNDVSPSPTSTSDMSGTSCATSLHLLVICFIMIASFLM